MPTGRRAAAVLAGLLAVWALATVTVLVQHEWQPSVDAALYLLTARNLAEGHGYSHLGEAFFSRPPGWSAVLALVTRGAFDPAEAAGVHRVVHACAALAFGAVGLALARRHGAVLGLLAALLFGLGPLTVDAFNEVLSEFAFMAPFYAGAALLLPARDGDGRSAAPGLPATVAGALLLGASLWMRSVGLLALPALLLARRAPGAGRGRPALAAALALAVFLPWMLHARAAAEHASRPSSQRLVFDYATALLHVDPRDPGSPRLGAGELAARAATNGRDLLAALAEGLLGVPDAGSVRARGEVDERAERAGGHPAARALALFLLLAAVAVALVRRTLLDVFLLLVLALLLAYFTFVPRLLLPVLPLLVGNVLEAAAWAGSALARRLRRPELGPLPPGVLAACLLGVALLRSPEAYRLDDAAAGLARADRRAARWAQQATAPDARLLHERGPVLELLSGRRTYTWRNLPGPWPEGCPPVDVAFYGPQDKFPAVEAALAAAARQRLDLPVPYLGGTGAVRVYRLR